MTEASATARVLVVDDDVTVRDVVRRYLERAGYAVTLASDGEEALLLVGPVSYTHLRAHET